MDIDERFGIISYAEEQKEITWRARRQSFARVMNSAEFTGAEKFVVEAQVMPDQMGNFRQKLWEAICAADEVNKDKLALAFPDEVAAVRDWQSGTLAERLRAAGLSV